MPFDWIDFISCAEDLGKKSDEASLRSSISRAYYGIFGKMKNYISSKYQIKATGENVHQRVIQALKDSTDKREYSLGNTLSQLRDSRNGADYDAHAQITKPLVDQVLRKTRDAIPVFEEIKNEDKN